MSATPGARNGGQGMAQNRALCLHFLWDRLSPEILCLRFVLGIKVI